MTAVLWVEGSENGEGEFGSWPQDERAPASQLDLSAGDMRGASNKLCLALSARFDVQLHFG
jgi:hypothetical protein